MANVISDETIEYVGILAGVEPMSHVFPVQNVFREDVVTNEDTREQLMTNAPEQKDGMFMVPRTFEA